MVPDRATMTRSDVLAAASLAGLILACGGEATNPSAPLAIAGVWTYAERITDAPDQIICGDTGTVRITQSGAALSGVANQTGLCAGPNGYADNSGSGTVTGGQTSGTSI